MKHLQEQDVYVINGDEMRKILHALWMARARNANKCAILYEEGMEISEDTLFYVSASFADFMKPKWEWVERKCLEKAKEFE